MNTNHLLASWSTLSLEEIEEQLLTRADEGAAEQLFGPEEMAEIQALAGAPRTRSIGEAVILLPGTMGSMLSSIRGFITLLWINPTLFLKGQSQYLELNEDGSLDGAPGIEAVPTSIVKLVYLKISLAIRNQAELFEFPYDWRRAIEWNADVLHQCIERWAGGDPNRQFILVGHSMGGLVSRAYLARHKQDAERRIKHVIMHGTPHYGAAGATENMILGNRLMDIVERLNPGNVPKRFLLNMPSVYQLLPSPPDLFPDVRPYPVNWDLYRATEWRMEGLRQDYLDVGQRFHELLINSDPQAPLSQINGCNIKTVVEVKRSFGRDDRPHFDLITNQEGPDAGDGTVPLYSALLPGANNYYIQEVHRDLPRNRDVIQATLDIIRGQTPALPTELPPRRAGWFGRSTRSIPPSAELEAQELRRRFEEGTATEEDLARLEFVF